MTSHDPVLYRLIAAEDWAAAKISRVVPLRADDERDGFVHLSTDAQVLESAQRYFAGQRDVLALEIDPGAVAGEIRFEPGRTRAGERFPHLYGALPVTAVRRTRALLPEPDGSFIFADEAGR